MSRVHRPWMQQLVLRCTRDDVLRSLPYCVCKRADSGETTVGQLRCILDGLVVIEEHRLVVVVCVGGRSTLGGRSGSSSAPTRRALAAPRV
eukprot:7381070-Prymnesium_polylepis.1